MPQFGNLAADDPLGIALQSRGQQARQQFNLGPGWGHPSFGPLPDPKMDGLFQAMQEMGVDQMAGGDVPNSKAFVGQQHLSGKNGAGEMGPQGFAPATGMNNGPMMGYGGEDNRQDLTVPVEKGRQALNGLNSAFKPNFGVQR